MCIPIGRRGRGQFGPMSGVAPGTRAWNKTWGREKPRGETKPTDRTPDPKRPKR